MMCAVANADSSQTNREFLENFQTRRKSISSLGCGLILLFVLSGCSRAPASVSGKLTLDGKALAGSNQVRVTIMFYPEAGGAPAAAIADDQGRYQLATGAQVGLAPGKYTVIVAATESAPKAKGDMPNKRL